MISTGARVTPRSRSQLHSGRTHKHQRPQPYAPGPQLYTHPDYSPKGPDYSPTHPDYSP